MYSVPGSCKSFFFSILFSRKDLFEILIYPPASKNVHMYLHSCTQVSQRSRKKVGWVRVPEGVWSHRVKCCIFLESKFYLKIWGKNCKIKMDLHRLYKNLHTWKKWLQNKFGTCIADHLPPFFPTLHIPSMFPSHSLLPLRRFHERDWYMFLTYIFSSFQCSIFSEEETFFANVGCEIPEMEQKIKEKRQNLLSFR